MPRECIFCGSAGPMTGEHVWPRWAGKALGAPTEVAPQTFTKNEAVVRSFNARGFDLRVKNVCGTCNSGWMSDLEQAVRPVLEPVMLGRWPVLVSEGKCVTLAAWVVKTTVMLEHLQPTPAVVPVEHRHELARTGHPPKRAQVWAGTRPLGQLTTRFDHESGGDSEEALHDGYIALMGIGQFFAYVASFPSEGDPSAPPPHTLRLEEVPIFRRLWSPPPGGTHLPPRWSAQDEVLDELWPSLRAGT